MGQAFASGKHAFGFCDRCGFRYALHKLQTEVVNLTPTNIRVCPSCFDPDQPQNQLGRYEFNDPQALRNPRPPLGLAASRYGNSVRFDFLTGLDGWIADHATAVWQSAEQNVRMASTEEDPKFLSLDIGESSFLASGSVSPLRDYKYARCLMSVVQFADERNTGDWEGQFFWQRDDEDPMFSEGRSMSIPRPDFESMGNNKHLLTWDLRDHAEWSGTITAVRFDFFEDQIPGNYIIDIDYVRFEQE